MAKSDDMFRLLEEARNAVDQLALDVFGVNPHWKQFLADAPEGARPFVSALFATSLLAWLKPGEGEMREVTAAMGAEDWGYLRENSRNQMEKAHYRKAEEMARETGKPIFAMPCELLNPFADLPQ